MQILLANAKIMSGKTDTRPVSKPLFQSVADMLAMEMASMSIGRLAEQLDCSRKLAAENKERYHNFFTVPKMPAILAYNGQAYEHLFDWRQVKEEVRVIQPLFYVRTAKGLKMQTVWAKSCRGAMVRHILENRLDRPERLQGFAYEGFEYNPRIGEADFPHFTRESKSSELCPSSK